MRIRGEREREREEGRQQGSKLDKGPRTLTLRGRKNQKKKSFFFGLFPRVVLGSAIDCSLSFILFYFLRFKLYKWQGEEK